MTYYKATRKDETLARCYQHPAPSIDNDSNYYENSKTMPERKILEILGRVFFGQVAP